MMLRALMVALAMLLLPIAAPAQIYPQKGVTIPLWPNGVPGAARDRRGEAEVAQDYWVRNIHNPSITMFAPDPRHANGAAVVVIPGGGHRIVVWTSEGLAIARALNRMGITVFVLKYRLAREEGSSYRIEDAADDARRAIRWVRANAERHNVDPARIGVMGFSAGGELVTLVADTPEPAPTRPLDALDRVSARPDFQIQVFPGPYGLPAKTAKGAPPAFLVAGSLDECCTIPTLRLYEQLQAAGVSAELHMYANAGHAFNLDETNLLSVMAWPDALHRWLSDGGFLDDRSRRSRSEAAPPWTGQTP